MGLTSGKILKISITFSPKEKILEEVKKYLFRPSGDERLASVRRKKPLVIVTPNPEQVVYAQSRQKFADILNWADVALPDGIGISLAAKVLRATSTERGDRACVQRIPGVEFMQDLIGISNKQGVRIGLIGGRGGVAIQALECLQNMYPKLEGWAETGPEIEVGKKETLRIMSYGKMFNSSSLLPNTNPMLRSEDATKAYVVKIIEKMKKAHTQILFVGLGAPKQEYFIARLARQLQTSPVPYSIVLMSVGGSFDMLAGRLKRAPLLIRSIGFEWFWRLAAEPWRWKRQLAILRFAFLVLRGSDPQLQAGLGEQVRQRRSV